MVVFIVLAPAGRSGIMSSSLPERRAGPLQRAGGLLLCQSLLFAACFAGAAFTLSACFGAASLYHQGTNYGIVIFESPVDNVNIERLRQGRVERTYDTLHFGGTRWHVPVGQWEFRIQGGRTDYTLDETQLVVKRASETTLRIVQTRDAMPPPTTTMWDDVIQLAEQELETAQKRRAAGVAFVGDVLKAEAGLIETKIQRERSSKNQKEVVSLLQQLVQVREKVVTAVQAQHLQGKTTQTDLLATIKSLVEAKAALEEASVDE